MHAFAAAGRGNILKPLDLFRNAFILTVLFALSGLVAFSPTASAAPAQAPPNVYINDKYIGFEVSPVTVNGHILVPVKKIFENFGAALTWDESIQSLTARNAATSVTLKIGSYNALVNGKMRSLDEPVQIVDGQTFAPLSFAIEAFGCEVNWDKEKQLVKIYYGSGQPQPTTCLSPTAVQPQGHANTVPSTGPEQQGAKDDAVLGTTEEQPASKTTISPPLTEPSGPTMAVSVTAADLHVRSGPSTSADIIGLVSCGTTLAYVGEKDGWYQVKYLEQPGWVAGWYCTPPSTATVSRGNKMTLLPVPSDPEAFVRQMKPYAETAHKGTGLPVNFLLAQWAEECGYGTSSLAQYYNNFGGIKDPDTGGFKQYSTPDEFARDVVRIYTEHSQYAKLLAHAREGAPLTTLFNDLSRCGYATSKNYGEKIRTQYLPTIDDILEDM